MASASTKVESDNHATFEGFPIPPQDRISLFHRLARTRLGVAVFVVLVLGLSIIPSIMVPITFLFVIGTGLVRHATMRRLSDRIAGCWIYSVAYGIEVFFGIRVRVFGHPKKLADRSLIILNHRCHFDWMYFCLVVAQRGDVNKLSFMLKMAGKYLPFIGWAMQFRNLFFLSRCCEKDAKELTWKLNYLKATNSPYQLLLFPEGTDFNVTHKDKSDEFAKTNGLPKLDYTLHPKSQGFVYTLKGLRDYKIDAVYDMTVGYPDNFMKTEAEFLTHCNLPREVHYHIVRHDASTIPETDREIEKWLRERWNEKDKRLQQFYSNRTFCTDKKTDIQDVAVQDDSTAVQNGSADGNSSTTISSDAECTSNLNVRVFLLKQLFYTSSTVLVVFLCMQHWLFVLYTCYCLLATVYLTYCSDGMDYSAMRLMKRETRACTHSTNHNGGKKSKTMLRKNRRR